MPVTEDYCILLSCSLKKMNGKQITFAETRDNTVEVNLNTFTVVEISKTLALRLVCGRKSKTKCIKCDTVQDCVCKIT